MTAPEPVGFGPFRLDSLTLELWRDGVRIPLEPLPARLLLRLAQDAGLLVSRRELLALGWSNAPAVTEQSLNTCIHEIRQALSRGGPAPVRLETLRGRGYRLAVDRQRHDARNRVLRARHTVWLWTAGAAAIVVGLTVFALAGGESDVPDDARRYLDRARYLAEETEDPTAARAVLDSARSRFPLVAAVQAEWAEVSFWLGAVDDARRGADAALRLDPKDVTAHRTRGMLALVRSDWAAAESALARARQLDPADTRTLASLAFQRAIQGRRTEADGIMRQALQIDPLSTTLHRDAGFIYLLAGQYAEAERYCVATLRFKPRSRFATDCLFDVMVLTSRIDEAARWGRRLLRLYDAPVPPESVSAVNAVAATEAWRLQAWTLAVNRGADPLGLALAYAANGHLEEALRALQDAATRPSLGKLTIAVDPRLAVLRERSDFRELLNRLKLAA